MIQDPDFRVVSRDTLFSWTPYSTAGGAKPFDLSLDDQQILAIGLLSDSEEEGRVVHVTNWFEELKRLVPN